MLDDSPPDRKTKWAGVAEFIATPASSDGKAEVNKPLNLVIHLSKNRFRLTPPHRHHLTSAPAERGLDDRRNGRPTQIRQILDQRQTSLSLEVSSPKLVGDLIVVRNTYDWLRRVSVWRMLKLGLPRCSSRYLSAASPVSSGEAAEYTSRFRRVKPCYFNFYRTLNRAEHAT